MSGHTLFLSYASVDIAAVEALEAWAAACPEPPTIWRDRREIAPGAPDYYEPILAGLRSSANVVILLSVAWLRSGICAQELRDAHALGKKLVPIIHADVPRDPRTPAGRARKAALMEAMGASPGRALLEPINWIWLREREADPPDHDLLTLALATDFDWKRQHAVIVQRWARWQALQDASALLRGTELSELVSGAFSGEPQRLPRLTDAQRDYLLDSQRADAAERERAEALYAGAQARSLAYAARERGEAEPDTALLLAAHASDVADVPQALGSLRSLLDRHARLTTVLHVHGTGRAVAGLAFCPQMPWVASIDRPRALNDDRGAQLLIHDVQDGRLLRRVPSESPLTAVAWGPSWLAVASPGQVGWVRWDEGKERFRGNSPTAIGADMTPDWLAFTPAGCAVDQPLLAWGTRWGDVGVIRVGDHAQWRLRVGNSDSPGGQALYGLAWLSDGSLLTAEAGQLRRRPWSAWVQAAQDGAGIHDAAQAVEDMASIDAVTSLCSQGDRWLVAGVTRQGRGLLWGQGQTQEGCAPHGGDDLPRLAIWVGSQVRAHAGEHANAQADAHGGAVLTAGQAVRTGQAAVTLQRPGQPIDVLLQGEDTQIASLASDASGQWLAAGDMDGRVWLWSLARRSHLVRPRPTPAHAPHVQGLASVPDGQAATLGADGVLRTYAAHWPAKASGESTIAPWASSQVPAPLLGLNRGQAWLLPRTDGTVTLVDAHGLAHTLDWPEPLETGLLRMAVAAQGSMVAVLTAAGDLLLLRVRDQQLIPVGRIQPSGPVHAVALDPWGRRIYWLEAHELLLRWQVQETDASQPARTCAVLRTGWALAAALPVGDDQLVIPDGGDLLFLPCEQPDQHTRRPAHDNPVKQLATQAHCVASVASWYQDPAVDQVRLWSATGEPLGAITLPVPARQIAFAPDGSRLVVLDEQGALHDVPLDGQAWAQAARRVAGRSLTEEERRRYGIDAWEARRSAATT